MNDDEPISIDDALAESAAARNEADFTAGLETAIDSLMSLENIASSLGDEDFATTVLHMHEELAERLFH